MDPLVAKLARLLGDLELAGTLVGAGFNTPHVIRKATNKQLKEVDGIGVAQVRLIRKHFKKR